MKLFEPVQVGPLTLRNRAVITSHAGFPGLYDSEPQSLAYSAYLERRAGGPGLIVLQCVFPPVVGVDPPIPAQAIQDRLARFAEIVHRHGGKVLVQIAHQGAQARGIAQPDLRPLRAMSAAPSTGCLGEVVHAFDERELAGLIEGYALMSSLAVSAGLDGVELHAGHGYLLHQAMSPWMNRRDDEWGAPLALITAALRAIRAAIGRGKVVGVRHPSDDHRPVERGGHTREQLAQLACELADLGLVDYISPTEGSDLTHYGRSVGTYRRPHGDFLEATAQLRGALAGRLPVLAVGRITSVEHAEQALQDELCDLVGMTRAHIADPDLLRKAAHGESGRVRRCVGANQGCIDRAHEGFTMTCFVNPEVGREERLPSLARAVAARRVAVVGGGPAGLKAAEIAARRGHEVHLYEANQLGGRLAAIRKVTRAAELVDATTWVAEEVRRLGVALHVGVPVDGAALAELAPDVVVLATGSLPVEPDWAGDGSVPTLTTEAALAAAEAGRLRTVVVYDVLGNEESAVTYEQLAALGVATAVVTPNAVVGAALGHTHASDHIERLLADGCTILERHEVVGVSDGTVRLHDALTRAEVAHPCDAVVLAAPRRPDLRLSGALAGLGVPVHLVGDAYAPRTAMHAIRHGYDVGAAL